MSLYKEAFFNAFGFFTRDPDDPETWHDGEDNVKENLHSAWNNLTPLGKTTAVAGVTVAPVATGISVASGINNYRLNKELKALQQIANPSAETQARIAQILNKQRWNIAHQAQNVLHGAKWSAYKVGQGLSHITGLKALERGFKNAAPKGSGLIKVLFKALRH